MISEQLRRRYELTISPAPGIRPLNPAEVVRWYNAQEQSVRAALDQAEPLTWTKHLAEHKPGSRVPWHLTAHIAEAFVRAQNSRDADTPMMTIPEHAAITPSPAPSPFDRASIHASPTARHSLSLAYPPFPYPSGQPRSRPQSILGLEPSLRRRRSNDEIVSFEPRVDSARSSLAGGISGGGTELRARRAHPLSLHADTSPVSSRSSLANAVSPTSLEPPPASPSSSRFGFSEYARRIRERRRRRESDGESSRNSLVDDPRSSASEEVRSDADLGQGGGRRGARPGELEMSPNKPASNESAQPRSVSAPFEAADYEQEATTAKLQDFPQEDGEATSKPILKPTRSGTVPVTVEHRAMPPRRARRSLPSSSGQNMLSEGENRRSVADEQKERAEYEMKAK